MARHRSPELVAVLRIPAGDDGIRDRQVQRREQAGIVRQLEAAGRATQGSHSPQKIVGPVDSQKRQASV